MRLQLLLGFVVIIAVVVGASWWMAVRTTNAEFSVLVTGTNQRQARLLAPALLEEYARTENWADVQENLSQQIEEQDRLSRSISDAMQNEKGAPDGVLSFSVQELTMTFPNNRPQFGMEIYLPQELLDFFQSRPFANNNTPITQPFRNPNDGSYYVIRPDDRRDHNMPGVVYLASPDLSWAAINIILADQRAIIIDPQRQVVVDSGGDLLGKTLQTDLPSDGVPLYIDGDLIGTLVITSRNGVYTVEQSSFLEEVKRGFLYSAFISTAIALLLALALAYQITRPIRSLTTGVSRIQAGDWGYTVNFKARNEMGQLATAFNDMSTHLAEQRDLRSRLVDDLAHELNTPLSLMRLEIQGMADGFQSPAEAADHLTQELTEVSDLVADLIFLANANTTPHLQMDMIDINTLVESAVKRFEGAATQQKKLTLTFLPQADIAGVCGDSYQLQRAVSNLLSNAIRHTPEDGKITVRTRQDKDYIKITVQDTGEGIPEMHLPHIFERFYRVDSSRTRQSGGRGLGLAIVKQILEQHGGEISVNSHVGKGSTFTITLPIRT